MNLTSFSFKKGYLAYILSITCLFHCILTPFLLVASPLMGHFFESLWIELSVLSFSMLCGVLIIFTGYCKHKRIHTCCLFALGTFFWILHALLGHDHGVMSDLFLLSLGSCFVIASYYFNHRFLNCCHSESACDNTHPH
ncbi:MAG: MerC domain-containing protein [bacterium]